MEPLKKFLDKLTANLCIGMMGILTIDVLYQVATRLLSQIEFLGMKPSSFTDELAGFLLIWVSLLGAAYVAGQDKHLALDILPNKLVGTQKKILMVVIYSVVFLFCAGVMVVGGIRLVYITLALEQKSSVLEWPIGYVYSIVPFSGGMICFYSIYFLMKSLKGESENAAALEELT